MVSSSDLHHGITGHFASIPVVKHVSIGHAPWHGASLHGYAHGHSHHGSIGPSGVVTGTKVVGPSGVVTGHGASGPSGHVNGHGAVGPSGEHSSHGHSHDLDHHVVPHSAGIIKFGHPYDFGHHSVAHHAVHAPTVVHGSHLHHDHLHYDHLHHDHLNHGIVHHAPVHHHVSVVKPLKYTSVFAHHH